MQQLYITEYIVLFWLNDISVGTTTQRDASYQIDKAVTHLTNRIKSAIKHQYRLQLESQDLHKLHLRRAT